MTRIFWTVFILLSCTKINKGKSELDTELKKTFLELEQKNQNTSEKNTNQICLGKPSNYSVLLSSFRFIFVDIYEREPNDEEVQNWWQALSQGASYLGILNGILSSRELLDKVNNAQPVKTQPFYSWFPLKENHRAQKLSDLNLLLEMFEKNPKLLQESFSLNASEVKISKMISPECYKAVYSMHFLKRL